MLLFKWLQKKKTIGMRWDIYEPIWFKLCMMRDTTELYSLTMILIHDPGDARKWKLQCQLFPKLSGDINGTWHAVETCWFDESQTYCILSDQYSRERIQLRWFQQQQKINIGLHWDIYKFLLKLINCIVTTSLYDLALDWKSQLYEDAENSVPTFLQISQLIWMKFGMLWWPFGPFKHMEIFFAWWVVKGENSSLVIVKSVRLRLAGIWMLLDQALLNLVWW